MNEMQESHKNEIAELRRQIDSLSKMVTDLQQGLPASFAEAIKEAVQTSMTTFKDTTKTNIEKEIEKSRIAAQKDLIEVLEKKEKAKNLVLVGLPEGDEESDWEQICQMADRAGIVNPNIAIKTFFRLGIYGKRNPQGQTIPRIIKIKFANTQYRETMLKFDRYKDLGPVFSRVFLRRDMTFDERKKDKELRAELAERRKTEANNNLVIRNGAIIDKTSLQKQGNAAASSQQVEPLS